MNRDLAADLASAQGVAHTSVEVARLPLCDFDPGHGGAVVDGKTVHGPWANMCAACYGTAGSGLGLGTGQHLTVRA